MKCLLCNSSNVQITGEVTPTFEDQSLKYDIIKCNECTFQFASGPFESDLIESIYAMRFHSSSQQAGPLIIENVEEKHLRYPIILNAVKRFNFLKKHKVEGPLLDIGAAKGYFTKVASESLEAEGIELNEETTVFARKMNVNVYSGNFMTHDFANRKYKTVCLWDVVASFSDPLPVFDKIDQIIAHGGKLVFTIPNSDSFIARVFGKFWPLMIPPINMGFYNKKSVKFILSKHGYKLKVFKSDFKYVSFDFLVQKLIKAIRQDVNVRSKLNFAPRIKIPIKLGDIKLVIAEKVEEV